MPCTRSIYMVYPVNFTVIENTLDVDNEELSNGKAMCLKERDKCGSGWITVRLYFNEGVVIWSRLAGLIVLTDKPKLGDNPSLAVSEHGFSFSLF